MAPFVLSKCLESPPQTQYKSTITANGNDRKQLSCVPTQALVYNVIQRMEQLKEQQQQQPLYANKMADNSQIIIQETLQYSTEDIKMETDKSDDIVVTQEIYDNEEMHHTDSSQHEYKSGIINGKRKLYALVFISQNSIIFLSYLIIILCKLTKIIIGAYIVIISVDKSTF